MACRCLIPCSGLSAGFDEMKVQVKQALCEGFGTCAKHAPDVFILDEWGYAATTGLVPDGDEDAVREAAATCPEQAIRHES